MEKITTDPITASNAMQKAHSLVLRSAEETYREWETAPALKVIKATLDGYEKALREFLRWEIK